MQVLLVRLCCMDASGWDGIVCFTLTVSAGLPTPFRFFCSWFVCLLSVVGGAYLNWLEKLAHGRSHWFATLLGLYLALGTPCLLITSFTNLPWLFISWSQAVPGNTPLAFISIAPVSNSPSDRFSILQIRDDSEGCTYEIFHNQLVLQKHVTWLGIDSGKCRDPLPIAITWGKDEQWVN